MKNTISYGLNTSSSSLNLSYHKLQTEGFRDNSAYNREGITLTGEFFKKKKSRLMYFGNYTYMKAYIPSSITKEAFENTPRAAAPTWVASQGYEEYNSYLGGLAYDWNVTDGIENSTSVFINIKENYEPRPFDILTQNTAAYGARTQFSGKFNIWSMQSQYIVGAEYFRDGFEGSTLANLYEDNNGLGSLEGSRLTGTEQNRDFVNAFAQLRIQLSRKFELQAGVNFNKTRFDLANTFPAENRSKENYNYNGIWSPQLSFLYKPSTLQTLYVSVSRGFSLPSIEETLTAEGTINPNIRPENGYNFELGGKFYLSDKNLYAEFAIYHMQIKDLLVAQRVGDDQYIGVNAGETTHQGIEIALNYNWTISPSLALEPYIAASIGNYKFKEFINNDVDYSGNELTGVPDNKINAGVTFSTKGGFYITGDYYFVDKLPLNDANTLYNEAYNLLNFKTGYRFKIFDGLTSHVAAGINNAANTHYASMVLVNATGFNGTSPRYYYPGQPVNYYANFSFSYTF